MFSHINVSQIFVLDQDEAGNPVVVEDSTPVRYPFRTGEELLARAFLHEIDHLDGHLYPEIAEKMLTAEELEEMLKQEEDAIEAEGEDE